MSNNELVIGKGFILEPGIYYFDVVLAHREELDIKETIILIYENGNWNYWEINKRIVDFMAYTQGGIRYFQGVTEDGFCNIDPIGNSWRNIDLKQGGPNNLKHMTAICSIDNYFYVVGMSRMVYRKELNEKGWNRVDKGIRIPMQSKEITGLTNISGLSLNEIYVVGFEGEIWWCNNGKWIKIDSPTNLTLNCVKQSNNGEVYICGNDGVVLKGRYDKWKIVEHDVTEEDLWDMVEYQGNIFIAAGMAPLYKINSDTLNEVKISQGNITTGSLSAENGELLSVGEQDILLYDSKKWTEIIVPPYSS